MNDLNELALRSKASAQAFDDLLRRMDGFCRVAARRFYPLMEFDDLLQLARIEVWNAVQTYREEKMSFGRYCRLSVLRHLQSRIHRHYGPKQSFYRNALRLHAPIQEEGTSSTYESIVPDANADVSRIVEGRETAHRLHELLASRLSKLEYDCLLLFYFGGYKYAEIESILQARNIKNIENALVRSKKKLRRDRELLELLAYLRPS